MDCSAGITTVSPKPIPHMSNHLWLCDTIFPTRYICHKTCLLWNETLCHSRYEESRETRLKCWQFYQWPKLSQSWWENLHQVSREISGKSFPMYINICLFCLFLAWSWQNTVYWNENIAGSGDSLSMPRSARERDLYSYMWADVGSEMATGHLVPGQWWQREPCVLTRTRDISQDSTTGRLSLSHSPALAC